MAAPEIPAKQKAAVFDQPGTVSTKVVELDVPDPGAGEVLINLFVELACLSNQPDQKLTHSQDPFGRMPLGLWNHDQQCMMIRYM